MSRPRLLDLGPEGIRAEMARMRVDPHGIGIMERKARCLAVRVDGLDLRAALVLKQDLLSLGGDVALPREAASLDLRRTPAILLGTERQLERLAGKIQEQPWGLPALATGLRALLGSLRARPSFAVGGRDLLAGGRTLVVGILNVTADSFSDGGLHADPARAVERGLEMAAQGADLVDVGGESTRPGARPVAESLEAERVVPVVRELARQAGVPVSVDTTKAEVARRALEAGASVVNDISGMAFDPAMAGAAAAGGAAVILMHTRGRPEVMQDDLEYGDLLGEVFAGLEDSVRAAEGAGIPRQRICVDPGLGFGKSAEQNLELLARLGEFRSLGTAVMVGASRKSFLGKVLDAGVGERLEGSVAAACAAALRGADLVRVHDVLETVKALKVCDAIRERAQ